MARNIIISTTFILKKKRFCVTLLVLVFIVRRTGDDEVKVKGDFIGNEMIL